VSEVVVDLHIFLVIEQVQAMMNASQCSNAIGSGPPIGRLLLQLMRSGFATKAGLRPFAGRS